MLSDALAVLTTRGPWSSFADLISQQQARLSRIAAVVDAPAGLSTGLADLDEGMGGLRPGELVVLAAESGFGATTLALTFQRSVGIRSGLPVAVFSPATAEDDIAVRIMSAEARIPLTRLRSGSLTNEDASRLADHQRALTDATVLIDATCCLTAESIVGRARRLHSLQPTSLVIVDDLDMLLTTASAVERPQRRGEAAAMLKALAVSLSVPVVAVCHLRVHGQPEDDDMRPTLRHLRAAGVEPHADVAILIWREEIYQRESPRAGEADLLVVKDPWVGSASATVSSQLHYARFVDMPRF